MRRHLLLILVFISSLSAFPQNRNNQNVQLTDEQVQQYWIRAQNLGYTVSEISELAKSQGFSERSARDLYVRIQRLERISSRGRSLTVDDGLIESDSAKKAQIREKLFGIEVFDRTIVSGFQAPIQLAVPQNYVIATGDVFNINVFGAASQRYVETVNPQGRLIIPIVGPIAVSGMTFSEAQSAIRKGLSSIYAGMVSSEPSVFVNISLENTSSRVINVVGEVERPGTYQVSGFSTVFNVLYQAGGITVDGTFRDVKLYRSGTLIASIDLYDFLVNGEVNSIALQDNDLIVVGTFLNRVEVNGEVKRPAIFELKSDDSVESLISYFGGFTANANRESLVIERKHNGQWVSLSLNEKDSQFRFSDGDFLEVKGLALPRRNSVHVLGAVNSQGILDISELQTVQDAINEAGGLLPTALLQQATLFRIDSAFNQRAISLNLTTKDTSIQLMPSDVLQISSINNVYGYQFLYMGGEVNNVGVYPFHEGLNVGDLIRLSGGFRNSVVGNAKVEIARRTLDSVGNPSFRIFEFFITPNFSVEQEGLIFPLQTLDQVFVRNGPGFQKDARVKVQGEVLYPGEYVIDSPEMRVSDLLERSGGFTDYAFLEGVSILRLREESYEQADLKAEIDQLVELQNRISEQQEIGTIVSGDLEELLDQRIENLRDTYERQFLLTKDGVRDLLYINPNQDIFSLDGETRSGAMDRIGIEVSKLDKDGSSSDNLILLPGDVLFVPKRKETVRINGAVPYKTATKYRRGANLRSYVAAAGGFSQNASRRQTYVVYANGEAKRTRNFLFMHFYPEVKPGANIVIPGGRIRNRLTIDRLAGITGTLITTYLLVDNFINSQQNP